MDARESEGILQNKNPFRPEIRILPLWQVWASLCVWVNSDDGLAEKQIETRSWQTAYRGLIAIHATASLTPEARFEIETNKEMQDALLRHGFMPDIHGAKHLPFGAIIGVTELVDCLQFVAGNRERFRGFPRRVWSFGDFTEGRFGWIFENPVEFKEPIPHKGCQGMAIAFGEIYEKILEQWKNN